MEADGGIEIADAANTARSSPTSGVVVTEIDEAGPGATNDGDGVLWFDALVPVHDGTRGATMPDCVEAAVRAEPPARGLRFSSC